LPFPVSQPTDPRSQDRLITGQRKTVSAKTKNRKSKPENQSQAKRKTQLMAHLGTIKRKTQSVQSSRNILSSHREKQAAKNLNHALETLRFGAEVEAETHFKR